MHLLALRAARSVDPNSQTGLAHREDCRLPWGLSRHAMQPIHNRLQMHFRWPGHMYLDELLGPAVILPPKTRDPRRLTADDMLCTTRV